MNTPFAHIACARRLSTAAVAFALTCMAFAASAATPTYTYSYVGNKFTTFSSSPSLYSPNAHVTLSLVFAAPLAANLNLQTMVPQSWTVSDTVNTFNSSAFVVGAGGRSTIFQFTTNAAGTLTGWDVEVRQDFQLNNADLVVSKRLPGFASDAGGYYLGTTEQYATTDNNSGSWTLSVSNPVPEASTGLMCAAGLLGLGAWLRRRV